MRTTLSVASLVFLAALASRTVPAIETEHLDFQILPAPGPEAGTAGPAAGTAGSVTVDGKTGDWDLSAGIFACGDVENARDKFAVWLHAMYDDKNLYILARWVDPTPMNNPGSSKGDYGFRGDCLQVRVVTAPDVTARDVVSPDRNAKDAPTARTSHLTCWRDKDGLDVVDVAYGRNFNEGGLKDAKTEGATQAFLEDADHKGYAQEMALPWKLLTKPGVEMKPGARVQVTFEPNFTVGTGGRLTIKDLFRPGVAIDRVFTFQGNSCWGYATLATQGKVTPRPVRLSDGREFAVRFEKNLPVVDWTGLVKSRLPDGFKPIKFTLPEDSYVSLNLFAPDGSVARQLLTSHFFTKGEHEIKWDGLTTPSVRKPGVPVPAGEYTWEGLYHAGIGLRLRGWAGNSGNAPWNGWGADHGNPIACVAAGDRVYVGWSGGEGDKPLLCCDLNGNVQWKNIRGGIASAGPLACDGTTLYAYNDIGQYAARAIYRLDARTGQYTEWSALKSTDLLLKDLGVEGQDAGGPSGLSAAGGRVFASFHRQETIVVVDAKTGTVIKKLPVPKVGDIEAASANQVFAVSTGGEVVSVNVETGETKPAAKPALGEKDWVNALALDKAGNLYLGIRGATHHVEVFGPEGKLVRTIGRKGGRSLSGTWTPDGMLNISGMTVDAQGKLWVAEDDGAPRRVSVWDTKTGELKMELFGASSYGAMGAAINPIDPCLMAGQGVEWRIDPKTGRAACLGTITRHGMGASRFGFGPTGRLYLATSPNGGCTGSAPVRIFERLGDADYKLRTVLYPPDEKTKEIRVSADENDDGQEQPAEVKTYNLDLGGWIQGWYLSMTPDMTFYGTLHQVKVTGWTACGAPQYDLSKAKKLAGPENARNRGGMGAQHGHGSADNRYMLYNGTYGDDHSTVDCYDIESGKLFWTYPSNFTGVHGSHRACAAEVGMMRGAYDIAGVATFPAPIGNIWVIPTNKGEWHVLAEKGYYLTRFFEGDPMKNVWPEQGVPGVSLDTCPPGAGEEAFGGSITQGKDGKLSVAAGHISFWNAEVVGLDTVKPLAGGKLSFTADDAKTALSFRERSLQEATALKRLAAKKGTPAFTGDLEKDFAGGEIAKYQKQDATACQTAVAWDEKNLYVGWEVKDSTPWVNGADAPEFMYARGDTVDLQLGTDPKAAKDRKDPMLGDLRLSIGPFQGKPTAVVYRKVAAEKNPKSFSSGVIKDYQMDSVIVLKDAKIDVKTDAVNKRYVVEAALPFAALRLTPSEGLVLRADVGATHGDKAGRDTVLRTHWSNQNTGLVSDEVFELQMTPANWGELQLK
ncbi:MAG: PQQ-binding-like beta-propeller repeat protein [Planctomycetota bacterium]|nr:PQQ-binding-like beta-propeller repeat protein [Planctomycetota bacterium]